MLDKFKDYFDLMFNENRLAHSFLIGNVLFDDIKNDLNEVIKKIFNNDNLNIESNPDIYILKNDDSIISKDDIKNGRVMSIEESKEKMRKKYANFHVK